MMSKINEPKKKNRWLIRFPSEFGIQEWWISSMDRPKITFKRLLYFFITESIEPINITFRETIENNELSSKLFNDLSEKIFDVDIDMLDPTGVVVEKFILLDCRLLMIDFCDLNYSKDEIANIKIKIQPGRLEIK